MRFDQPTEGRLRVNYSQEGSVTLAIAESAKTEPLYAST
jgi:hypothetical protein